MINVRAIAVERTLEEAVVYRLYSGTDDLLYVGYSGQLRDRLSHHSRTRAWWNEVARVEFDGPFGVDLARLIERHQIRELAPLLNRMENLRRGWDRGPDGALAYFPENDQFRTERVAA